MASNPERRVQMIAVFVLVILFLAIVDIVRHGFSKKKPPDDPVA